MVFTKFIKSTFIFVETGVFVFNSGKSRMLNLARALQFHHLKSFVASRYLDFQQIDYNISSHIDSFGVNFVYFGARLAVYSSLLHIHKVDRGDFVVPVAESKLNYHYYRNGRSTRAITFLRGARYQDSLSHLKKRPKKITVK